jgi:hypothetical protein
LPARLFRESSVEKEDFPFVIGHFSFVIAGQKTKRSHRVPLQCFAMANEK